MNGLFMEAKRSNISSSSSSVLRGCIKTGKGPWLVRRATKDGAMVTKLRFPSERERMNNKHRERRRRSVAHKIFAGLRAHGNYNLPRHADSNDLLMAVCEEAGWHVEEDGTIFRKECVSKRQGLVDDGNGGRGGGGGGGGDDGDEEFCKCGEIVELSAVKEPDTTLAL